MTNATAILSIRSTSSILNMLNIESFFFFFFFPPTIESCLLETVHVETIWPVFLYKMNRTTCYWSNARRTTQHTCIQTNVYELRMP